MEILNLEGTEDTPKIILDKKNGIFEISGRSRKILPSSIARSSSGLKSTVRTQILQPNLYSNLSILIQLLQS